MSYEKTSAFFGRLAMAAILLLAMPASAQNQYLGDVNHDGQMNIQDVQATIAQALGELAQTGDADLDGNAGVDVIDVQNMVNTALQNGGLVQRIVGRINCGDHCENLWIVGVSKQGNMVKAKVDRDTGGFVLRLRTHTAWALMLCRAAQNGEGEWRLHVLATLRLRLGDNGEAQMIPLMALARRELNIGDLDISENRLMARETFQRLLGWIGDRIDATDENQDGIPDFIEPLLERLRQNAPGVPQGIDISGLKQLVRPCVVEWLEAGVYPDLTDENENNIPDFVEPLLDCIRDAITPWLQEHDITVPQQDENMNGVPDFVDALLAHIRAALPQWLTQVGRDELVDENRDGVPDYVEDHVGRVGTPGPMDSDGDGIPNFAEDNDGDGIPNMDDPDCAMSGDDDCDGVPNEYDWDHDNNGVPDYAE